MKNLFSIIFLLSISMVSNSQDSSIIFTEKKGDNKKGDMSYDPENFGMLEKKSSGKNYIYMIPEKIPEAYRKKNDPNYFPPFIPGAGPTMILNCAGGDFLQVKTFNLEDKLRVVPLETFVIDKGFSNSSFKCSRNACQASIKSNGWSNVFRIYKGVPYVILPKIKIKNGERVKDKKRSDSFAIYMTNMPSISKGCSAFE